jgi:tetratricopeptide (TPR) repeat protein
LCWHALQLYTQADNAIRLHSFDVAAEMLERALQDDPNFASAQLLLGFAYADAGNDPKSAPYFERAFELADTVTDRERFFILGSYYEAVGHNPQKVVDAYETLLQLYPDHFWGTHNLSGWYESMGRMEDAARL